MADFMKILQQAQEMQGRFQKIQEELQQMTVTGSAGGGMVIADVTGTGQLKKIKLDPSVVNPADIEMLEDLVTAAVSDAHSSSSPRWSVSTRFSSSGMLRSNERMPASTCATGIRICAAASAPASVEFVSP